MPDPASSRGCIRVVCRDPDDLAVVTGELERRYGADYDLAAWADSNAALDDLRRLRAADRPVALVLACQHAGDDAVDLLGPAVAEAAAMGRHPVVVVGGGNSAGQAALHLSRYASSATLLVRGASLAASMSEYLIRELRLAPNVTIRYESEVVAALGDDHLEQIEVRDTGTGATETLAAAGLFVLIGSQLRTEWLPPSVRRDEWGFVLTGREAGADPATSAASSQPGVFAAGDVRRGSIKRVASAVGEGAVVISQVHAYLNEWRQAAT